MPATPPLCRPCPRHLRLEHPRLSPRPLPARSRPGTSLCRGCHIPEIVPDDFRDERPLSGRGLGLKRSITGSCQPIARYAAERQSGSDSDSDSDMDTHSDSSSASGRRLSR